MLLAGLGTFGAAAAIAFLAEEPATLIAMRAVMGAGAAMVMPVTLSVITTSFPEEERGRAVGVWVGVVGAGAVLGLLAWGVLLELFDWSSFFALSVALAVLAIAGTIAKVPASRDEHPPPLDPVGALLSLAGISAVVFAIIEAPEHGWLDALIVGCFAAGALLLVAFVAWELRRDQPMLDPRLFRLRGFGTGALSLTVQFFAAFGFFFVVLQYLQFVVGLSPLVAALCLMPMPVVMIPLARKAPDIADRRGINRVGAAGLLLIATGLAVFSLLDADFTYWHFAGGLVLFAAGMALAGTPATTAIVSSLPPQRQGVASAVNDTSRELGGALGIALLGAVLNQRHRSGLHVLSGLPDRAAQRAGDSIAFVQQGVAERLGPAGERIVAQAEEAYVAGFSDALIAAAAVLLVGAVYVAMRGPRETRRPAAAMPGAAAR